MGKKAKKEKLEMKVRKHLEKNTNEWTCEEAADFIADIHRIANKIRTVSGSSQEMNEFSESFDDMLNCLMKMDANKIQVVQRLW